MRGLHRSFAPQLLVVAIIAMLLVTSCSAPASAPAAAPAAPAAPAASASTAAPAAPATSTQAAPAAAAPGQVVAATREPAQIVRFVFAPDPVWDYMKDTGILATYEDKYNMKVVNTSTWDEVAWFVGGHADIASQGTYEVPIVAKNSGKDYTIFGKYNSTRSTFWVKADSPYHSIQDLVGKKIAVLGPGSNTMAWGAMFKKLYNLEYKIGGGDFKLFIAEYTAMPPMIEKGEVDAAVIQHETALGAVVDGKIRFLNEQTMPTIWEFYRDNFDPQKKHQGLMSNTFVAETSYIDKNPKAIQFFLSMWQAGEDEWYKNRESIVKSYPQHFAWTTPEQADWLVKFQAAGHDWFVKDIALDDAWVAEETKLFALFRDTGRIAKDVPDPKFRIIPIEEQAN